MDINAQKYTYISPVDALEDHYYLHNAGENTACVVYLHGHGSHGDQPFTRKDVAGFLHPLIKMYNLSIVSPNLRDNAWMSPAAVTDLAVLLTGLKKKYSFSRFLFICGSMGGTGGLIFATLHPELVDGLGIMGGVTDIAEYCKYCAGMPDKPIMQEICQAITGVYTAEDYKKHCVLDNFEKLTMPLCFYHGGDDPVMPVSGMLELQRRMNDFPSAEFRVVPGTHDAPLAYMAEILEKISGLQDFDLLNKREHATARDGNPAGGVRDGYNFFAYYQGEYYIDHPDEVPECVRHARSIAYALANLPLDFAPDQMFFGGAELYFPARLPAGICPEDFQKKSAVSADNCQRGFAVGWDHTAADNRMLVEKGLGDFISRAQKAFERYHSPESMAMLISLKAVSDFFIRAANFWQEKRPQEAARLRHVATAPPETFAEALQLVWLIFIILEAQGRFHNALGRMDQYLYEVFRKDSIDKSTALNMLCHIFCKVEGLHQVTNICIGGVKPDGSDAVNELSYLILQAVGIVKSVSANLSARVHENIPDDFLRACIRLISTGIGFPAIMNDAVYISSLQKCGIPLEAARDYALFGCVEGNIPGRAPAWSDSRFNLAERFMEVVERLEEFSGYDGFYQAFAESVRNGLNEHLQNYNKKLLAFPADKFPDPLLSALTGDCIAAGKDINAGGAEFPRQHGVGMVGPATIADSLAAVKKLVFEEKRIGKKELLAALHDNFKNAEVLRQTLINCAPKFGNDDPYVDSIFADIVKLCGETANGMRCCDGGFLKSCMASNINNVACGRQIPATPDGRLAGEPLSDAASPSCGMDRSGPTAFINSITVPDYSAQNCTVVNMRFTPDMFADDSGVERMLVLLKKFISGKGHEIQFNVTDNEVLLKAVDEPEKFADLTVRVSGFSALFVRLSPEVQKDIIRRNIYGK